MDCCRGSNRPGDVQMEGDVSEEVVNLAVPKTDNELLTELLATQQSQLEQHIIIVNSLDWLFTGMFGIIGLLIIHLFFLGKGDH